MTEDRSESLVQYTGQVFWFIEGFYNTSRKHSFLGQISPAQFEERNSTT